MAENWTDRLAGARMEVDREFEDRLSRSSFSSQEWGLIMTAVEFDIEHAGDPERAELVANTDHVADVLPELERLSGRTGRGMNPDGRRGDRSLLDRLRAFLGAGEASAKPDEDRLAAAVGLVEEYTEKLQAYLERESRWEEIRTAAAEG